jgi:hypothetical protein
MNDLLNQLITQVDSNVTEQRHTKRLDYILLDGSGSMSSRWMESLNAIDKYAKGVKDSEVETKVIMATFSGSGYSSGIDYTVARSQEIALWLPLGPEPPHCPGGGTPLYDAINIMVRACRDENPDDCSIIIVTDGEENGSRTTDETQARALLDWCRHRGWQVTFIGADFNNSSLAKRLGGGGATAIGAPTKRLTDITSELAKKRGYHAKFGTPMHFSEEERKQFGGYLSDQSGGK